MRKILRLGLMAWICLFSACQSSMPPRVPPASQPSPQVQRNSPKIVKITPTKSIAPPTPGSPASVQAVNVLTGNNSPEATVPEASSANAPNTPKMVTVLSPQAEFAGNAVEAIDDSVPLETSVSPKNEPIVVGTTKPYIFNGETITPMASVQPFQQTGVASWYGKKFHGRKTASGEVYNMYKLSAAHRTLPIPSYVQVTNLANQKSVIVRVNDRGPFTNKRVLDLSYAAAKQLEILQGGSTQVDIRLIDPRQMGANASTAVSAENLRQVDLNRDQSPTSLSTLEAGLYVQAGAFSKPDNAKRLHQRLAEQLPDVQALLNKVYNGKLHQVVIGPYPDQALAAQMVNRLREQLQLHAIIISKISDISKLSE